MKICLLGDFSPNFDEGYKNVSHYLAQGLEKHLELIRLDTKRVLSFEFWETAFSHRPQIVHLIGQPTLMSLLFLILSRLIWKRTKKVISALRPEKFFLGKAIPFKEFILGVVKPDLIFVQSHEAKEKFSELGFRAELLPNGVDTRRFSPVSQEEKHRLRSKYNLDPLQPVILHVGHLEKNRNIQKLIPLLEKKIQVVVAGSIYMGEHHHFIARLESSGMRLFKGYQPDVEELYQLSDCYVFPVEPGDSLSMPLSVLEAMACNLRVVTTRFKGLETVITEGDGFEFVDSPDEVLPVTLQLISSKAQIKTRDMVLSFSWENIAFSLINLYSTIDN